MSRGTFVGIRAFTKYVGCYRANVLGGDAAHESELIDRVGRATNANENSSRTTGGGQRH